MTGWFDLAVSGKPANGRDPFLTPEWVRNRGRDYLAGQMNLDDPRVSPAHADLSDLPPMYLQIGQFDTVREGASFACHQCRTFGRASHYGELAQHDPWMALQPAISENSLALHCCGEIPNQRLKLRENTVKSE